MRSALLAIWGVLIVAVSGCKAQTDARPTGYVLCGQTGVYRNQQGILRVCSPITDEVFTQVSEQLTPTDREIILTSDGGPQVPAIALARLLRDRDITVRVRQFCLSSCSTYVMAMAQRVIVDPYTVVAFHHTAAFLLDAMASRAGLAADSWQRRAARSEREAYRDAGRDDGMLDRIAMAVLPVCVRTGQANGRPEAYVETRWDWFIPDQAAAREIFGDRISGHWMADGDEGRRILQLSLGLPDSRVVYGPLPPDGIDPDAIGRDLPACA
jgi:hypothetical protein